MWCCFSLLCLLPLTSATNAVHLAKTNLSAKSGTATVSPSSSTNGSWHMSPVTVVHARIQGDAPVWNKHAKMWLSKYGDTAELAYMNNLDTVNTASVEGAHEYGEFVAMDTAKCTDENSGLSVNCKLYYGLDSTPKIGPMVGGNLQTTDPRAPYPHSYWFSYPHSCAQKLREEKTDECRAEYPGGLCPMGVKPDGDKCTFSYKILGYLNIDDLVGITEMGYSSYKEFCEDGGVEFKASNIGSGFDVEESIDFWKNPGDKDANSKRAAKMVKLYNKLTRTGKSPNMMPLPSVKTLAAANPKCYKNNAKCASAQYGCRRLMYSQICSVCNSSGDGCEVAPSTFSFPALTPPTRSSSPLSNESSRDVGTLRSSDTAIFKDVGNAEPESSTRNTIQSSSAVTVTIVPSIVALVVLVTSSLI